MTANRFHQFLRTLAIPCALFALMHDPATAAPQSCYYFAFVEAKEIQFPDRGLDAMVILDVIRVPKEAYSYQALREAARDYIAANLRQLGLRSIERERVVVRGKCTDEPKGIANMRLFELEQLDSRTRKPDDWLKKVGVLHGVWSKLGEDSGLSTTSLYTDLKEESK